MNDNSNTWREGAEYEAMAFDGNTVLVWSFADRQGSYFNYPAGTADIDPSLKLRATVKRGAQGWEIDALKIVK